jgi:hypothetical protein
MQSKKLVMAIQELQCRSHLWHTPYSKDFYDMTRVIPNG